MSESTTKKPTKILIVDDHPAIRDALALQISRHPDLEVCGEAADVSESLNLFASTQPDVAVIDITLKTGCGLDLIKRIKERNDSVRMLVWSAHPESLYADRALRAGALGYINKDQATGKIIEAIRRVHEGKVYLSDAIVQKMLHRAIREKPEDVACSPLSALSDRELEVFRLIGRALKTTEIAKELNLSVKTVETYRNRIRLKLDLSDGTKLAHRAMQWELESA